MPLDIVPQLLMTSQANARLQNNAEWILSASACRRLLPAPRSGSVPAYHCTPMQNANVLLMLAYCSLYCLDGLLLLEACTRQLHDGRRQQQSRTIVQVREQCVRVYVCAESRNGVSVDCGSIDPRRPKMRFRRLEALFFFFTCVSHLFFFPFLSSPSSPSRCEP